MSAVLSGVTLLVVDDDEELREVLKEAFERKGATVRVAGGTHEALKVLSEVHTIDLVFSDMRMPDGDGFLIAQAAKEKSSGKIAVIIYSGFHDLLQNEEYRSFFDAVLSKPTKMTVLIQCIVHTLAKRNAAVGSSNRM